MKRISLYSAIILTIIVTIVSCTPVESFDEALLIGKWKSGTLYYRYDNTGSGATWDTADDVTEAEGTKFTWILDQSDLTQILQMDISGATVTKAYTVTKLTSTTLEYKDELSGKTYTFTKQ